MATKQSSYELLKAKKSIASRSLSSGGALRRSVGSQWRPKQKRPVMSPAVFLFSF